MQPDKERARFCSEPNVEADKQIQITILLSAERLHELFGSGQVVGV